jgi:hypothetical protein
MQGADAMTVTKAGRKQKRTRAVSTPRARTAKKRVTTVADMTPNELRAMIQETLSEWLGDPDEGLEVRLEIIERIQRQRAEYAAGKRGKSLEEIAGKYGVTL